MKYLEIRGDKIPALGIGTYQLDGSTCRDAVAHALALGYRHVDTAQAYGNEKDVGRGMRRSGVPRHEIFLTTKIWWEHLHAEDARRSAEVSLRKLGTDYLDLLLIHWPSDEVAMAEPLDVMLRLREEGKVRHLGVSNFPPTMLVEAMEVAPVICDQVEYHPFLSQNRLLDTVRGHGIFMTAYSPVAQGKVMRDATLRKIGEAHDKNPAQVSLRWLMQQDAVAAIPRSASPEHRESNLDVFDFDLSDDEMASIFALAREERLIDPAFAPEWERAGV